MKKKTKKKTAPKARKPIKLTRIPKARARGMPAASSASRPSSGGMPRAFEGSQALIPGVKPRPTLVDPMPNDHEKTVMTIRTTRGVVRLFERAAKLCGDTYPMNWARRELMQLAAQRIREGAPS